MVLNPFRCAFPLVKLPLQYGGEDAIVIVSVAEAKNPRVVFATCIDRRGRIHQSVPFSMLEIQLAASPERRAHFLQVSASELEAPLVGGGEIIKS